MKNKKSADKAKKENRAKLPSYPHGELKRLFGETGNEIIQGVRFELSPEKLVKQGWRPWELRYGTDPLAFSPFPWVTSEQPSINAGDVVRVDSLEHEMPGDDTDHSSDQKFLIVTLGVYRQEKRLGIDLGPIEFYQDTSFLNWLDFNTAADRMIELIGNERSWDFTSFVGDTETNPSTYSDHWDKSQDAEHRAMGSYSVSADKVLSHAFAVNARWRDVVYECRSKTPENSKGTNDDLLGCVARAIDSATAFGYWLAKLEFAPFKDDTKEGRKIKKARSTGGSTQAKKKQMLAAKWQDPAFKERSKGNSRFGQKALAHAITKQPFFIALVDDPEFKAPATDTIIAVLKKWEDSGELPTSIHKRAMVAGGVKEPK
jgi:hypothetical protein